MAEKVRVQPEDIHIPDGHDENPFQHDQLGRREPVTILTDIISSIEGPCVLAVDAPWGEGKTTFIKMWTKYLESKEFPVVTFSAWETDFSADPFIALSEEISEALEPHLTKYANLRAKFEKVGRAAMEVVIRSIPGLVTMGTGGLVSSEAVKAALDQSQESAGERISGYREARKAVREFRNALQEMAESLAESNGGLPLVVVIDELDRCRPTYAAKLLEVAKHLFAVDNIVFVLAVNRAELEHSIRGLYGSQFDAAGYLRRFFDIDFHLPEPSQKNFIEANLKTTGIERFFEDTNYKGEHYPRVKDMILSFFSAYDISLRTISQSLHRLGLTLASLSNNQQPLGLELVVALIVRTVDIELYRKLRRGEATDEEVAKSIFGRAGTEAIRGKSEGILFEAILIVGMMHMTIGDDGSSTAQPSPLLDKYKTLIAEPEDTDSQDPERIRAVEIDRTVTDLFPSALHSRTAKFGDAVQRLELVSRDFIREES